MILPRTLHSQSEITRREQSGLDQGWHADDRRHELRATRRARSGSTISTGSTNSTTGPNHATGKHSSVPVSAASGAL